MSLGAIILCGGHSRRMGQSKAWLPFGPELMLQRVVRLLSTRANHIVVVAAAGQELPDLPPEVLVVRDAVPDRGPLEGLAAGLGALPETVELAYSTATDVPFLNSGWIDCLVGAIGACDLAIPRVNAYHHPLAALYRRRAILPASHELLRADRLRLLYLMDVVQTRVVGADELRSGDPTFETLRNLNTPEDYELALRDAGFAGP